jgi:DNA modification methylase
MPSYEAFLDALDDVMRECWRVLVPGGRFVVNVGDEVPIATEQFPSLRGREVSR